ncbi:hypothetical protein M0R45_003498 [Rubus argutus]|uniref:Sodefrin-like factor n=1 Tax=Rubus argutus TaxID=59490 RepID=A0AAW1YFB0_RUBAR
MEHNSQKCVLREPETLKELRDATASHPIDSSLMNFCQNCQNAANVIERKVTGGCKIRGPYYRVCDSADDIEGECTVWGQAFFCQELFSMGISLKFATRLC